jgi:arylsulfatase A-like enzyme
VELRDVFPTLYETAGGDLSKLNIDGQSIWSLVHGNGWRDHLDIAMEGRHGLHFSGILTQRYKYHYYYQTGNEELFDMD